MKRNKINVSILISIISIISISLILQNVSGEIFSNENFGLNFEYSESWKLHSSTRSLHCNESICEITFKNLNDDNILLKIRIQKGQQFKNICKCDSLVEYVQYEYTKYYEPNKSFSLINDNQTTLNGHINAIQMEYTSAGQNSTHLHFLNTWFKNNNKDIFYKIVYQSDNNNFNQFLSDVKIILNSMEFFNANKNLQTTSNEAQSIVERKQPSFMIPKNESLNLDQKEITTQQSQSQSQQQFSKLTTYKDPRGKFTLEYDPSFWIAIPNNNRFDGVEVGFIDKATGGDETAFSLAFIPNHMPNHSIRQIAEQLVPTFLSENVYIDRQLEEGIECGRMNIQGNSVCSFVYSEPEYYFNSYSRNYFMMFYAKIGNELLMGSFTSLGNQFDNLEQNVIQMVNSMNFSPNISPPQAEIPQKLSPQHEEQQLVDLCAQVLYDKRQSPLCQDLTPELKEKVQIEAQKLQEKEDN